MKKIVKLTENDLVNIIKKVISESKKSTSKTTKKQKGGFMKWFTHSRSRRRKHKKGCGHTMKHRKNYK